MYGWPTIYWLTIQRHHHFVCVSFSVCEKEAFMVGRFVSINWQDVLVGASQFAVGGV